MIGKVLLLCAIAMVPARVNCAVAAAAMVSAEAEPVVPPAQQEESYQVQFERLARQVRVLAEHRSADVASIEKHMRRRLAHSEEVRSMREELASLRLEVQQLRIGGDPVVIPQSTNAHAHTQTQTQAHNDQVTATWLSHSLAEIRTEVAELQRTLNSSALLRMYGALDSAVTLVRTDADTMAAQLTQHRSTVAQSEATVAELAAEVRALRGENRALKMLCSDTRNELKSAQLDWSNHWTALKATNTIPELADLEVTRMSRHQRIVRKHIIELQRAVQNLTANQAHLKHAVDHVAVPTQSSDDDGSNDVYDRINGNDLERFLNSNSARATPRMNELKAPSAKYLVEKVMSLDRQQRNHTDTIANLTRQLTNFDRLHMSMLELLENVEAIESKVDDTLPTYRKEISKMEIQLAENGGKLRALQEDHANIHNSVQAIGVGVSILKDKFEQEVRHVKGVEDSVAALEKSSSVQHSKLHDHILKSESSSADDGESTSTETPSAQHLVQELRSFESEYRHIVNKLPHDCAAVTGAAGVYLLSPDEQEPVTAYCDHGWTVTQRRRDGSVNFNRPWAEYATGFGQAAGEYWLGNRHLAALTQDNCTRLEIRMKDIYGKYWSARYETFHVAAAAKGFKLAVGGYSGNASDAMDYQNRMEFSAIDNDRDISNTHCAGNYEGGWWFSHCQHVNLNGRYNLGLTWFDSSRNEWIAVSESEMRVQRRENCPAKLA